MRGDILVNFLQEHYLLMRLLACFLLGFWWCVSGCLLQWTMQNPLACPVTLGLTAFPVTLWLVLYLLGFDPESGTVLTAAIFITVLVHYIFYKKNIKNSTWKIFHKDHIILIGVALNLSLAALYSFFYFYHSAQGKVLPNALWFGLLKNMEVTKFVTLFLGSFLFFMVLKKIIIHLRLLSLGKDFASNFIDVESIEKKMLIMNSALMCFIIFTGGVFAFWGLLLPHFVRSFSVMRGSLSLEIYGGGVMAGFIMMFADYLCYEFPFAGSELPVGLLSSILGPILLVSLLVKNRTKSS